MVSPTLGAALLTVLVTARSACWGVSVALLLLLPGWGSTWSARATEAVFVCALGLTTFALSVSVAVAALPRAPTVQVPKPPLHDPWLGLAETRVKPDGRTS